jgi:hypothetical protein
MTSARIPSQRPRAPGRQELRFHARFPVTLLSARHRDQLATWDVSFRGMFIETDQPLALRQLVRLGIILPITGRELVLHGMVVNVVDVDDPEGRPQGMGVELFALDTEARGVWWGVVRFVRDGLHDVEQTSAVRVVARLVPLRAVPNR